jgi:hypothetical protein
MKNDKTDTVNLLTAELTGVPWPQETAKLRAAYESLTNPMGGNCLGPGFVLIEHLQEYTKSKCSVHEGGVFFFDVHFLRESSLTDISYELFRLMTEAMTFVEGTRSSDAAVNEERAAEIADRWLSETELPPAADPSNN